MLLSTKDIKRIESLGYSCDFFVDIHDGWFQLKNRDGHCVFHNGMKCLIYKHRPKGCQLYPIIFDKENNCAILDEECPYRTKFLITMSSRKKLFDLVSIIESERFQRTGL
jgi:Fe-S-cluster containining protein